MKLNVPIEVEISKNQEKAITIKYLYSLLCGHGYHYDRKKGVLLEGDQNYHNGDWSWKVKRQITQDEYSIFNVINILEKETRNE